MGGQTLNTVRITGKRQCELVDVPDPRIREDFVLVKNHSAPMCTEYHMYEDGVLTDCIGHEAAGEVVEVARPGKVRDAWELQLTRDCGKVILHPWEEC